MRHASLDSVVAKAKANFRFRYRVLERRDGKSEALD